MASKYRRALITYIDILGFRELIEASKTNASEVENILELVRGVKQEFSAGGRATTTPDNRPKSIFYSTNFSDLTVRTTLIDETPSNSNISEYLNWEFLYIGGRQLQLALKGVLLRGGICVGDIYVDKEYVFGPGLVKSYALESKYAVFPRVAVDWKALHDGEKNLLEGLWHDRYIRAEDGVFYIDYLFSGFLDHYSFPGGEYPDPWQIIEGHKNKIEEKLQGIEQQDERVRQKYMWMGLYHNKVVERLSERIADSHAGRLHENLILNLTF